jgi:hypothetical protein
MGPKLCSMKDRAAIRDGAGADGSSPAMGGRFPSRGHHRPQGARRVRRILHDRATSPSENLETQFATPEMRSDACRGVAHDFNMPAGHQQLRGVASGG